MNEIKFSHDYEKLPYGWEDSIATLLSVTYCPDIQKLKETHPKFIEYDTTFRNEIGSYDLDFREGIILVFIKDYKVFTTIRSYTIKKYAYYSKLIWKDVKMVRA